MCGITGIWQMTAGEAPGGLVARMLEQLVHRGPDDGGVWTDSSANLALGHRRLSILDLSPQGHQPMHSGCGRYVLVFNGEIYNYHEIRTELDALDGGIVWRGHSDTEVMLEAFCQWGILAALERFNGMFAFALWDRLERVLYLARDRLGEKPLYYGWSGTVFLFASELKAITAYPGFAAEIDRDALAQFIRFSYIPAPATIYRGIHKLHAGALLLLDAAQLSARRAEPMFYWDIRQVVTAGAAPMDDEQQAADSLDSLLRDSVRLRMEADVPLGAFLSGGLDSSLVAAMMQAQSLTPVKTYTIGFEEADFNEALHARQVAAHLGTEHTELYVTPADALAVIPHLPQIFDEPFADPSQIPTYLVAKLTRQHVTVALSGDGGDELFAGYTRYFWSDRIWGLARRVARPVRRGLAHLIQAVPPRAWDRNLAALGQLVPGHVRRNQPGDKVHKLAGLCSSGDDLALYQALLACWKEDPVLGAKSGVAARLDDRGTWRSLPDYVQRMMCLDTLTYLPDDILVKVDRAAMAVSLETRVPLLDHRVVEFAWRTPLAMKVREGHGKWLLRQVLYRYVPQELVGRPKMGFSIPLGSWLKGPLRDWAESLLDERRVHDEGFFDPAMVRRTWQEHLSGVRNWQYALWNVLMFQAWLEHQGGGNGGDTRSLAVGEAI